MFAFAKHFVACCLAASIVTSAQAEEKTKLNEPEARALMAAMDREQTMLASYQSCPAEIFRSAVTLGSFFAAKEEATEKACALNPAGCLSACLTRHSEDHCYRLALALQEREDLVPPRYAQILFAAACAQGEPSGCTNRAAHLRNAMEASDPLQRLTGDELAACEHRSFKIACKNDDGWGCAMLGQSYRYGEGTQRNEAAARRFYKKACARGPDSQACGFARADLDEMRRQ
ncbi:tetratricopeptide repeat protein [Methylocystis sp. S23]